jgi:hypothetical protein
MEIMVSETNVKPYVDKEELKREKELQKAIKQSTAYAGTYTAPVVNPKYLISWPKLIMNSLFAVGFLAWFISSYLNL